MLIFSPLELLLLLMTAALAGIFNAIAGGGSFLTFPMLIVLGMPAIEANATSTIGLWCGVLTSAYAYRRAVFDPDSSTWKRSDVVNFSAVSLVGGMIGAWLLLRLPAQTFTGLVPYLMLFAVSLFTLNPVINRWLRQRQGASHLPMPIALVLQFGIAIYGGYFGGGASILMLAVMGFMGLTHINAMNGMKSWLGAVFNCIAIGLFIQAGKILWLPAGVIALGSMLGAYVSAMIAQRIPAPILRRIAVTIAWAMTAYLFGKTFRLFQNF
ncbi:MAG: hypothetical protein RLZZ511_2683 [Cyanobacteriota bacterium]|jgi:uncharacterized membrane protein YfcA